MTEISIEERVRLTEDRPELFGHEGAYGRLYDGRASEEWAGWFTGDGVYEGRGPDGMPPMRLAGRRSNLEQFCSFRSLNGMPAVEMPKTSPYGDGATKDVHFDVDDSGFDEHCYCRYPSVGGNYDVVVVRAEDGWRIRGSAATCIEAYYSSDYDCERSTPDLNEYSCVSPAFTFHFGVRGKDGASR